MDALFLSGLTDGIVAWFTANGPNILKGLAAIGAVLLFVLVVTES